MKTNQNFLKWQNISFLMAVFFAGLSTVNASTFKWVGGTSSAWSTASNWDVGTVPTSSDDVIIDNNTSGYTNAPVLDGTGLACLTLSINNAASLTGASGTDLTVSGNLNGSATLNGNASTIYVAGNMTVNTFNKGTSTIVFDGSSQTINIIYSFYNLTIASGITTIASSISITGTLTVNSGAEFSPQAGNIISGTGGNLTGAGTIDVSDQTASVDNFSTQYGLSGTVTLTNLTVKYDGSGAQHIGPNTFGSVTIDNSNIAGVTLIGTVTIGKNLTLTLGPLNATWHTINIAGNIAGTGSNFNAGSGLVVLNGAAAQSIVGITFRNLTMNNTSGGVTLVSGNTTVGDSLSLTSGIVFTDGSDELILSSAAIPVTMASTTSSNTSYIDGPVENTGLSTSNPSFLFPTGNLGKYAPIALSSVAGAGSSFTVQYFKSAHTASMSGITGTYPSATVSTMEYWTVIENTGTSAANVTLYWLDGSFSAITTPADLAVFYSTGVSGWSDLGAHGGYTGNASSGTLTTSVPAADMDPTLGFYTFGDTSGTNPLPVSLVNFTALYKDGHVNLDWATASEQNNAYFDIERSIDAESWTTIGQVQGHGTTNEYNNYSAVDNLEGIIPSGTFYYRLKQVDFNGAFTYSMIRSVDITNPPAAITAYPNPTKNILNVNWTSKLSDNTVLRVVDMNGVSVYEQTFGGAGLMQKQIDMSTLANGIYYVQIISGNSAMINQAVYKN